MIRLENYLCDGACSQAMAVMAYLRERYETILNDAYTGQMYDPYGGVQIFITRHEYGREHGYVFSLRFNYEKQVNYAVFEHCVSDCICVQRTEEVSDTPNVWKNGWEKYEHTAEFHNYEIRECGEWIAEDMMERVKKFVEERKTLAQSL